VGRYSGWDQGAGRQRGSVARGTDTLQVAKAEAGRTRPEISKEIA
jgi:hypothetical protein